MYRPVRKSHMFRSAKTIVFQVIVLSLLVTATAAEQPTYSWRYYRPGNTGIQGDYNEAIWIAPDGNPWVGGYNPVAEEGGFAKFVQAENRWINVSNIDYPVIGSANDVGFIRVTDMVADGQENLWLGTWRGVLRMNLAAGPSSLVRFGPGNSALVDDMVYDADRAPDGSIWFVNQGIVRYQPTTNAWTRWNLGNVTVGAQPKPNGGYMIWSSSMPPFQDYTLVFDSDTQQWTTYTWEPQGPAGQVVGMPGKDCVDDSGNLWALRTNAPGDWNSLDYRRPDGTWVAPPEPYPALAFYVWAFKAYGDRRALAVDDGGEVFQFNGSSWSSLGVWRPGPYTYSIDIDATGNVWVSGIGGAAKRDFETGQWQRYRVTNTSQFDLFNNDVAIDPSTDDVYACANANSGIGGMVKFDGTRWTGFVNEDGDGLTGPWPWPGAPQSEAVYVRPSNGHVVANPINQFTHEFDGMTWTDLPGGSDQMSQYVEDSLGRLWGIGHYGGLGIFENGGYTSVPGGGWGATLRVDPDRAGTIWCNGAGGEVRRTDGGTYNFEFTPDDVPGLDQFAGLAVGHNGLAWVGAMTGTGGALIRIDANEGTHQVWRSDDANWPFPTPYVTPQRVTPDGRVWMVYGTEWPFKNAGLLWWDGTEVGIFPAPPNGEWQWGGMPHYIVLDMEVKIISEGYELWMSCASRGIAVLTVMLNNGPVCPGSGILVEGTGEVGDFNATCGSDDSRWGAHGEVLAFRVSDPVVQFELTATAPAGFGGSTISVDIEASKQNANGNLNLRALLFNFTTDSYVTLTGIMPLTTADAVKNFALPAGSDPADFIEPGTNEVRLLLQTIQTSGLPNVRTQLDEVLFNFQ